MSEIHQQATSDVVALLTVEEAARLLRLTPAAVYARVRRGQLPYVRFGRLVRFDARDLTSFVNARRVSADALARESSDV